MLKCWICWMCRNYPCFLSFVWSEGGCSNVGFVGLVGFCFADLRFQSRPRRQIITVPIPAPFFCIDQEPQLGRDAIALSSSGAKNSNITPFGCLDHDPKLECFRTNTRTKSPNHQITEITKSPSLLFGRSPFPVAAAAPNYSSLDCGTISWPRSGAKTRSLHQFLSRSRAEALGLHHLVVEINDIPKLECFKTNTRTKSPNHIITEITKLTTLLFGRSPFAVAAARPNYASLVRDTISLFRSGARTWLLRQFFV